MTEPASDPASDTVHSEPFLLRPPPRCLMRRPPHHLVQAALRDASPPPLPPCLPGTVGTVWPIRASFEQWARWLLRSRSGGTA